MVTEKELLSAIWECEQDPITPSKFEKLAHLYIVHDYLYGDKVYSYSNVKEPETQIKVSGESEFLKAVNGISIEKSWAVIDELMETIKVINPKLYNGVLRKLDQ